MQRKPGSSFLNQISQLAESDTENYRLTAAASATIAALSFFSYLEGATFTSTLSLAIASLAAGAAANQAGMLESIKPMFASVTAGFFGGKKPRTEGTRAASIAESAPIVAQDEAAQEPKKSL